MAKINSVSETTAAWAEQRQISVVYNAETGSTNDDAKKNAMQESADLVLYLASHQSAGRGRGKNTWLDTGNGESLLSTWSFDVPSSPQAIAAPRIGLALFKAVSTVWPSLNWSLKAPNDLFLNSLKVAGLLVESQSSGNDFRIVIGLGFNVLNHPRRFSEADHLTQILLEAPDEGEWFQFLDAWQTELTLAIKDSLKAGLSDSNCRDLMHALNANAAKAFTVTQITAQGDIHHTGGKISWTTL